jgi:hypothetical protein
MDNIFANILILPLLNYFQYLYGYFSLILPYIIYGYLWLFLITFDYLTYFTLSYFRLL